MENTNKPRVTDVLVEIDGKIVPIRELSKADYESFLENMNALRIAYHAALGER